MSQTTAVVLIAALDAFVVAAVAYFCSIPFQLHKAPHTSHFFNTVLRETPDVTVAPEAYTPLPALD